MPSYTAEHLAVIRNAYVLGVKSVTFNGRTTVFRDLAEMREIIDEIERDLGLKTRIRRTVASYNGGFG